MAKKKLVFHMIDENFEIKDSMPMDIMSDAFKKIGDAGFKTIDEIIPIYNFVSFPKGMKVDPVFKGHPAEDYIPLKLKGGYTALLVKPEIVFRVEYEGDSNFFLTTKSGSLQPHGIVFSKNMKSKNKM